jgi:hypothetical protein
MHASVGEIWLASILCRATKVGSEMYFYIGTVVRLLIEPGTNYVDDLLFTRVSALQIPRCYFKMEQDHSLHRSFRSVILSPSFVVRPSNVTPKVAALSLRKPPWAEIIP